MMGPDLCCVLSSSTVMVSPSAISITVASKGCSGSWGQSELRYRNPYFVRPGASHGYLGWLRLDGRNLVGAVHHRLSVHTQRSSDMIELQAERFENGRQRCCHEAETLKRVQQKARS